MVAAAECRPFEFPAVQAAVSVQELQMEKRHSNCWFAGARDFLKFVKGRR
jgi:hypothetical protein